MEYFREFIQRYQISERFYINDVLFLICRFAEWMPIFGAKTKKRSFCQPAKKCANIDETRGNIHKFSNGNKPGANDEVLVWE